MRPWDESESIHSGTVDNRKAGTIASGNQVRDTYNDRNLFNKEKDKMDLKTKVR